MKDKKKFSDNFVGILQIVLGGFGFVALVAFWMAYIGKPRDGLFWEHFKNGSIGFIFLFACFMLWVLFYAYPKTEEWEQKKVIRWKCEYCGDCWLRIKAKGKPYPYQTDRCSRAPGGEHVLFEDGWFDYNSDRDDQHLLH
jgi:hypothetical protein